MPRRINRAGLVFVLFAVPILLLPLCRATSWAADVCGDYSCDGQLRLPDIYIAFNYIAEGYPSCEVDSLDIDHRARISVRDVAWLARHLTEDGPPPACDSIDVEMFPQPSADYFILYDATPRCDISPCSIAVEIVNHRPLRGLLLGMRIRLDGALPDGFYTFDAGWLGGSGRAQWPGIEEGLWLVGSAAISGPIPPGRHLVGRFVQFQSTSWAGKSVDIELVDIETLYYDSAIARQPAACDHNLDLWEIRNGRLECPVRITGDGDMNGALTASDIITLVNYVFKSGLLPLPCASAGDVNCDLTVGSSDIIFLVNHVFKGGAPPCDVCTVYAGSECE